jgi:hypothetical protein
LFFIHSSPEKYLYAHLQGTAWVLSPGLVFSGDFTVYSGSFVVLPFTKESIMFAGLYYPAICRKKICLPPFLNFK